MDQLKVLLFRISVLAKPFHTIDRMDAQLLKLPLQFIRQLQHLPLGQSLVFLLKAVLFLFKIPPQSRDLQ